MAAGFGALLDAVRGVRWPARRTVPGVIHGAHHSRLRGVSPEFTEYRSYRQGDDPRRIDWKLLGRTDRVSIRLSDDRAVLPTMLIVDASASMAFPEQSQAKWTHARALAVALAAIAHGQFDPVGLAVTPSGSASLPPRTRRSVIAEFADRLSAITPSGIATLADAMSAVRHAHRVVVISDFLSEEDEVLRAARALSAAGIELHAVHVVAREELELASAAALVFDPEDTELVRPLTDSTRAAYARRFAAWREQLALAWRSTGAFYVSCSTSEEPWRAARRIATATEGV